MAGEHTVRIGVLADPGIAVRLARSVEDELPRLLRERIDRAHSFTVEVVSQAVPLSPEGEIDLREAATETARDHEWDLTIVVTELPRRSGTRPLVVDAEPALQAAIVSVPALGVIRLRARLRAAIVRAAAELRMAGIPPETSEDTRVFRTSSHVLGRTRLVLGMIRINRPWRLVPSLSTAMAAAAAASAFGIFYSSIWEMAVSLSQLRLAFISALAITAMVAWLIVYNRVWERSSAYRSKGQATLYNVVSVLSIGTGVALMYAALYAATVAASLTVISEDFLGTTLGRPAQFSDYLVLSWLSASLGTVAGALGSSAEDDEDIKRATFGHREWERRKVRSETNEPEN